MVELAARRLELARIEQELSRRGFRPDPDGPVCRWRCEGLLLDVMPADRSVLGFGNRWFGEAVRTAAERTLSSGAAIRLIRAPEFLATKLEAFGDRGRSGRDIHGSHDLEDVIGVVDGRASITEEARAASEALRRYLAREVHELLSTPGFEDAVVGHLPQDAASRARAPAVVRRLREIAG